MVLFAAVPSTPAWSMTTAFVMIFCNLAAIGVWKGVVPLINSWLGTLGYESRAAYTVPEGSEIFTFDLGFISLTLPELVGATCLGHILGIGTILGHHYLGAY